MSSTPSIPTPFPSDKDPPTPSSPRPSHLLPTSHDNTSTTSMAPPRRPTVTTRTTSFDPQPHILNPSPLIPHIESASSPTASKSWQQKSETKQQQQFTPFFTLVNDTTTSSTYHPSRIHYIFSDDDVSEVLTSSLLKTAQTHENPILSQESLERSNQGIASGGGEGGTNTSSSSSATFRKPSTTTKPKPKPQKTAREERVIIVDLDPTLTTVTKISSLSKEWQVLNASVERAPSFDPTTAGEGDEGGQGGLMLRIEGVGVQSFAPSADDRDGEEVGKGLGLSGSGNMMGEEEMQSLLEGFDKKMAVLRRVVSYAGVGKEGE